MELNGFSKDKIVMYNKLTNVAPVTSNGAPKFTQGYCQL